MTVNLYRDTENGGLFTPLALRAEFDDLKRADPDTYDYDFNDYLKSCTDKNGFLEPLTDCFYYLEGDYFTDKEIVNHYAECKEGDPHNYHYDTVYDLIASDKMSYEPIKKADYIREKCKAMIIDTLEYRLENEFASRRNALLYMDLVKDAKEDGFIIYDFYNYVTEYADSLNTPAECDTAIYDNFDTFINAY